MQMDNGNLRSSGKASNMTALIHSVWMNQWEASELSMGAYILFQDKIEN